MRWFNRLPQTRNTDFGVAHACAGHALAADPAGPSGPRRAHQALRRSISGLLATTAATQPGRMEAAGDRATGPALASEASGGHRQFGVELGSEMRDNATTSASFPTAPAHLAAEIGDGAARAPQIPTIAKDRPLSAVAAAQSSPESKSQPASSHVKPQNHVPRSATAQALRMVEPSIEQMLQVCRDMDPGLWAEYEALLIKHRAAVEREREARASAAAAASSAPAESDTEPTYH